MGDHRRSADGACVEAEFGDETPAVHRVEPNGRTVIALDPSRGLSHGDDVLDVGCGSLAHRGLARRELDELERREDRGGSVGVGRSGGEIGLEAHPVFDRVRTHQ